MNAPTGKKHEARILSTQILYSILIDKEQDLEKLTSYELEKSPHKLSSYKDFIKKQVEQSVENRESIEMIISKYLKEHKAIRDIQPLLISVLMNAFTEIFTEEKTPKNVIINEYIEVCSNFFDKKECSFVNAVLDKYIKEFQSEKE